MAPGISPKRVGPVRGRRREHPRPRGRVKNRDSNELCAECELIMSPGQANTRPGASHGRTDTERTGVRSVVRLLRSSHAPRSRTLYTLPSRLPTNPDPVTSDDTTPIPESHVMNSVVGNRNPLTPVVSSVTTSDRDVRIRSSKPATSPRPQGNGDPRTPRSDFTTGQGLVGGSRGELPYGPEVTSPRESAGIRTAMYGAMEITPPSPRTGRPPRQAGTVPTGFGSRGGQL